MNTQKLQQIIQELADKAVSSNRDVWPKLREKLATQQHIKTRNSLFTSSRFGRLAFALSIIFIISITAYASEPWINRLIDGDIRLQHVDLSLRYPLNLSQTIDDVTITLEWAYADNDWVLIGYNIRSSDQMRFESRDEILTEIDGITLPWQGSYGFLSQNDIQEESLSPGEYSYVGIFENLSASRSVEAHFEVYAQELLRTYTEQTTPNADNSGTAILQTPMLSGMIVGPFKFDFVIPEISSSQHR